MRRFESYRPSVMRADLKVRCYIRGDFTVARYKVRPMLQPRYATRSRYNEPRPLEKRINVIG